VERVNVMSLKRGKWRKTFERRINAQTPVCFISVSFDREQTKNFREFFSQSGNDGDVGCFFL
jgi:hypothetical protein